MMSMAVVGLFWKLLYDPSWGPINFFLGLGRFEWLSNPDVALYAVAITDIWMWSPFVMLLSLAGLSAVPGNPGEYSWNGAFGTQFFADPKEKLVVVVGTVAPGDLRKYYREQIQALVYGAMVR